MADITADIRANEFGEMGYLVVDVEALILGPRFSVVEQLGLILRSNTTGEELLAEKFFIYQPLDTIGITRKYQCPFQVANYAVNAYRMVTGDNPIHANKRDHFKWSRVRSHVLRLIRNRVIKTYAKGAALERMVLGNKIYIDDLEWFQCPRYPLNLHDPLEECRFFASFIPELMPSPLPGGSLPQSMLSADDDMDDIIPPQ